MAMHLGPTRRNWLVFAVLGVCGWPLAARGQEPGRSAYGVRRVLRQPVAVRPVAPPITVAPPPGPPAPPPELSGSQPVEVYIRRALAENRLVQAAMLNVEALRHRVPQVASLDDPVVSNTIFPGAMNGFQTADGYMPWNLLIAQQFPWFGTLRLRGLAASQDVQVAIAELAAAQLDAVAGVKRAYYDLYFNERAESILRQNRELVGDFIDAARFRYESNITRSMQEVLRAEVALADLDRELIAVGQGLAEARAALAELIHVGPQGDLRTIPTMPAAAVPESIEPLCQMALASRPELQGRLAAVARDRTAVELARKRTKPDVTLGVNYMMMSKNGAVSPVATGNDTVGMFVGFNLPIYHAKNSSAICEAQARAAADARLYEAERDSAFRQIQELLAQARASRDTIDLFRSRILPRSHDALEVARNDYRAGNIDYVTLITAWREVLQIELQVAQYEAELGKTLASLERAVGVQLAASPPASSSSPTSDPDTPLPPPTPDPGPFGPDDEQAPHPLP